jgi:hypothetical protein
LNREIAVSSVVCVAKGCNAEQSLIKKGIKVEGMWFQVETYRNEDPTTCEDYCRRGHFQNKYGTKPTFGYYSGQHWTSNNK